LPVRLLAERLDSAGGLGEVSGLCAGVRFGIWPDAVYAMHNRSAEAKASGRHPAGGRCLLDMREGLPLQGTDSDGRGVS